MRDLIERYVLALPERKGSTSHTVRTYRTRLRAFAAWMEATGRSFTRLAFVEYLDYLREERAQAPRTIRPAFSAIRDVAVWMKEQGLEAPDLIGIRSVTVQKGVSSRYNPTDREVGRMLDSALALPRYSLQDRMLRCKTLILLSLVCCTAVRRGEFLAVLLDDVVIRPGTEDQAEQWLLRVRKGKGKKTRLVPINPDARRLLNEWFATRRAWVTLVPARKENPFLLPVDSRRPIGDRTVDQIIGRLNQAADLQYVDERGNLRNRVTMHCLRHWAATKMGAEAKKQGIGLKSLAEILGHASTHTTEGYLHPVQEEMEALTDGIQLFGHSHSEPRSVPTPEPQRPGHSPENRAERRDRTREDVMRRRRLPAARNSGGRTPDSGG